MQRFSGTIALVAALLLLGLGASAADGLSWTAIGTSGSASLSSPMSGYDAQPTTASALEIRPRDPGVTESALTGISRPRNWSIGLCGYVVLVVSTALRLRKRMRLKPLA